VSQVNFQVNRDSIKPVVWFNKNFSPTTHSLKALLPHAKVFSSHTSSDSPMLYGDWHHFLEPAGLVGQKYLEYALEVCAKNKIDLFVPSKEATLCESNQGRFNAQGTKVLRVADKATLQHLEDKAAFSQLLPTHIARVAQTITVHSWAELEMAATQLRADGHLVCIKPAIGVYGYGFRLLTKQEDMTDFLKGDTHRMSYVQAEHVFKNTKKFPPMLVMEFLSGAEYSIDCLAHNGFLVGAVIRKKVGGLGNVQLVCGSLAMPDLHRVATELTKHYGLNGIFNIQFKEDQNGLPCILEINARPSGGLRFSMMTGFAFVEHMMKLELGLVKPEQIQPPLTTELRVTEVKEALLLR
jgi:carbamoylphosphate synthase large subunit